jgi:hypothetical protein
MHKALGLIPSLGEKEEERRREGRHQKVSKVLCRLKV